MMKKTPHWNYRSTLYWPLISTIFLTNDPFLVDHINKTCWVACWVAGLQTPWSRLAHFPPWVAYFLSPLEKHNSLGSYWYFPFLLVGKSPRWSVIRKWIYKKKIVKVSFFYICVNFVTNGWLKSGIKKVPVSINSQQMN